MEARGGLWQAFGPLAMKQTGINRESIERFAPAIATRLLSAAPQLPNAGRER